MSYKINSRGITSINSRRINAINSRGFGQVEPPPPRPMNIGLVLAWGSLVAVAAGLFWGVTNSGTPRRVRSNRRRSTRRNPKPVSAGHARVSIYSGGRFAESYDISLPAATKAEFGPKATALATRTLHREQTPDTGEPYWPDRVVVKSPQFGSVTVRLRRARGRVTRNASYSYYGTSHPDAGRSKRRVSRNPKRPKSAEETYRDQMKLAARERKRGFLAFADQIEREAASNLRRAKRRRVTRNASYNYYGTSHPDSYRSKRRVSRNKISKATRASIPASDFVFPRSRRFPLDTADRARAALAYLRMGRVRSKRDFDKVKAAVRRRYPGVFFRYAKGLTWSKTSKAISKRASSRGRRRSSRRVAANRR